MSSIADRTVKCPTLSCGTMLVLSTYNTNICPNCGYPYRKHVEMQAFTELLIRSQEEEDRGHGDINYFRGKLNYSLGVDVAEGESVPEEIDDNGDMP